MKYLLIIISIVFYHSQFISQLFQNSGAFSTAMAGLDVNNENIWSINNNIGQLSKIENSSISISSFQPFLIKDFTTSNFVYGLPTKKGALGVNYSNSGNKHLQMHNIGIGYSMMMGENFHSGVKMNYYQINAGDFYNNKSLFSATIGMGATLTNEIKIGAVINNLGFTKLANYNDERLSTNIMLGASYNFSKELILHTGVEKNINYPASFLAGINYQPNDKLKLNGGVGTKPNLASFGFSLIQQHFIFCFASQMHQYLGWSPDISITYCFK